MRNLQGRWGIRVAKSRLRSRSRSKSKSGSLFSHLDDDRVRAAPQGRSKPLPPVRGCPGFTPAVWHQRLHGNPATRMQDRDAEYRDLCEELLWCFPCSCAPSPNCSAKIPMDRLQSWDNFNSPCSICMLEFAPCVGPKIIMITFLSVRAGGYLMFPNSVRKKTATKQRVPRKSSFRSKRLPWLDQSCSVGKVRSSMPPQLLSEPVSHQISSFKLSIQVDKVEGQLCGALLENLWLTMRRGQKFKRKSRMIFTESKAGLSCCFWLVRRLKVQTWSWIML